MQNARLDEAQTGIKIAGRNINNVRCADNTTLMAESKEELTAFWWRWKRTVKKAGVKVNIQTVKVMASSPTTSWQIDRVTIETVTDFIFLGSKITVDGDMKLKDACSLEEKL